MIYRLFYSVCFKEPMDSVAENYVVLLWFQTVDMNGGFSVGVLARRYGDREARVYHFLL